MLYNRILIKLKSNNGFMGQTHSLSAVAVYLLLAALAPNILFGKILQTNNPFIFIASIFIISGGALLPDFDNTQSTARNSLGFVGASISNIMRSIGVVIYQLVKAKGDDGSPNPHRLFWHTLISSLVVFLLVLTSTSINTHITLFNKDYSIGFIFATLWIFICIHLSIAIFFGSFIKKMKKKGVIGKIIILITSLITTSVIFILAPSTLSYSWMAYVIGLGYLIHILGDTITIAGTPLLWPIKHKGKRWWNYHIIGIKAGGPIEKLVFIPIFLATIVFSLIKLISYILI